MARQKRKNIGLRDLLDVQDAIWSVVKLLYHPEHVDAARGTLAAIGRRMEKMSGVSQLNLSADRVEATQ